MKNNLKHRTSYNYDYKIEKGEINNLPSKTVPNEALSIRQMLQDYVRGVPLPIGKNSIYDNSSDFEDVDETRDPAFDLSDASQQKRMLDQTIRDEKERLKAKQKAKDDAANSAKTLNEVKKDAPES